MNTATASFESFELGQRVVYTGKGAVPSQHEMAKACGLKRGDECIVTWVRNPEPHVFYICVDNKSTVHNGAMFTDIKNWIRPI